jgi:acetoin utilization deacetylase AcuC-like enzyme
VTLRSTGYTYDPRFLLHDTGVDRISLPSGETLDPEPHPSSLRIVRRTAQLIRHSGLINDMVEIPARAATTDDLLLVHARPYVDEVRRVAAEGGGTIGGNTPVVTGSWDAALIAAGTAIGLTDVVLDGVVRNAFGLVRPPGHHALAEQGMGFCLFNNVALAARHALARRDLERVAIVDWDVHHGNGTQAIFWDDPAVLVISLHQEGWYPGDSGAVDEIGGPSARGYNINVPLPPGTGDRGYELAMDEVVAPLLRAFEPELILVSSGHDASMVDPLGRMMVTSAGFRSMSTSLRTLADGLCVGRLVVMNEGGYSAGYTPFCALAVLEAVVGVHTEITDPLAGGDEHAYARGTLRDEQRAAVQQVAGIVREHRSD